MRGLKGICTQEILSLEALSVIQLCTINETLFPNLKTLDFLRVHRAFVPSISLFLSPTTTSIILRFHESDPPEATVVGSLVTTFPKLCPELREIVLHFLPRDPIITAAVSGMVLATNRNKLQLFHANSPLTEEAGEVLYKLSSLRMLSVVIERETSLTRASLPNLTELVIRCENEGDWPRLFHRATFGKLEFVTFHPQSEEIGDFLGAFERVALSSSLQNTLSKFRVSTSCSWNPNYSSLLSFTQLVVLNIGFSCDDGCSSTVDDDIVIDLSQTMTKLRVLKLGGNPCGESTMGVTAKGLTALALGFPDLRCLRIHFQVASLSASPANPGISRDVEPTGSQVDCALWELAVGEIVVPEESVLTVALTLLRIFPRIGIIHFVNDGWRRVEDAIQLSKQIHDYSSEHRCLATP